MWKVNLLQILGDIVTWTSWPGPWMSVVIEHSRHYLLWIASVFVAKFSAFGVIVVRHAQSSNKNEIWMKIWSTKRKKGYYFDAYTCPSSCAIVKAADKPLSWTIAHDDGRHIVPNSANPNVSHFFWFAFRQICSLKKWFFELKMMTLLGSNSTGYLVSKRAVSWWNGWCWTNLQNRDSICEAETPKMKSLIKIYSNYLKWCHFLSLGPTQPVFEKWTTVCTQKRNYTVLWQTWKRFVELLNIERHLQNRRMHRKQMAHWLTLTFSKEAYLAILNTGNGFFLSNLLQKSIKKANEILTGVIVFNVQIVFEQQNMNDSHINWIPNTRIGIDARHNRHEC